MNADFNFKAARYVTLGNVQNSFDRAEPVDQSDADNEEAELQDVEQQCNTRRCYTCGTQGIYSLTTAIESTEPKYHSKPETWYSTGKRRPPVGAGRPTRDELGPLESLRGRGEQGLAPKYLVNVTTNRNYNLGVLVAMATIK